MGRIPAGDRALAVQGLPGPWALPEAVMAELVETPCLALEWPGFACTPWGRKIWGEDPWAAFQEKLLAA